MENQYISELFQVLESTEIRNGQEHKSDNHAKQLSVINVYVPSEKYGIVESIHNLMQQQIVDMIMDRDGVRL